MKDERIVLSIRDQEAFEEIHLDIRAAKAVFDQAQTRFHNTLNRLYRAEQDWWVHVAETHNIDPTEREYTTTYDTVLRRRVVTPADEKAKK